MFKIIIGRIVSRRMTYHSFSSSLRPPRLGPLRPLPLSPRPRPNPPRPLAESAIQLLCTVERQ